MTNEIMHGLLMFVKCSILAFEVMVSGIVLITLTQKFIDWLVKRNDRS